MIKVSHITCGVVAAAFLCVSLIAGSAFAEAQEHFDFTKTSTLIREMEPRSDFPVAITLASDYTDTLLGLGETIQPAAKVAIVQFIKNAQQPNGGFVADSSSKDASLLYTQLALDTLAELNELKEIDASRVKSFVTTLKNADGGFGFSQNAPASTLPTTYYAVRTLQIVGGLDRVDRAKTVAYVQEFEKQSGGFGFVRQVGVATPRNTYMALYILKTLGALNDSTRESCLQFLATTPYLNEKSRQMPDLNELSYTVESLQMLNAAERLDRKRTLAFLKRLYIPVNGGFGPLLGYGSTPGSTATAVRILSEIGA